MGRVTEGSLTAPGRVRLGTQNAMVPVPQIVEHADFDIVFPLTAVAHGELRKRFPRWGQDRRWRGVVPLVFLHPKKAMTDAITAILREAQVPVMSLHACLPFHILWDRPFSEWTQVERENGVISATWRLGDPEPAWRLGVHTSAETLAGGLSWAELLQSPEMNNAAIWAAEALVRAPDHFADRLHM